MFPIIFSLKKSKTSGNRYSGETPSASRFGWTEADKSADLENFTWR